MSGINNQTNEKITSEIIKDTYGIDVTPVFSRPDPKFGDLATNVALQLAGKLGEKPRDVASELAEKLSETGKFKEVSIAGPGFINLRLSDWALIDAWGQKCDKVYANQTVIAEYSDPNAFKVLHAGHLYTSIVGDAVANLVENAGGDVHRVNFGGDVGLHVGKTMWAILQEFGGENPEKLAGVPADGRADWLAKCYVKGTAAYDEDPAAHSEIVALNKRVYALHDINDHDSDFAKIYWTTRQWSYDYFNDFYARIGSHFEKYYPESQTAPRGLIEVKKRIGTVFEESDGAVIFDGEKHGLHTRVFINREGLPTYETKDIGLIYCKYDDYGFDKSIIITADEQKQYMQVVLKALEQFAPELALATRHITHGVVKLAGGVKMSSRKGNFLKAVDVLEYAKEANAEAARERGDEKVQGEAVSLGAVKYAFLKQRIGGDIIYDPNESVSLAGNSGPYLMYAHARACSILEKAKKSEVALPDKFEFDAHERALAVKIGEYTGVVNQATRELLPHLICTYLYELAGEFNRFYEKSRIIGDSREVIRLALVQEYGKILSSGLGLLGIPAPKSM